MATDSLCRFSMAPDRTPNANQGGSVSGPVRIPHKQALTMSEKGGSSPLGPDPTADVERVRIMCRRQVRSLSENKRETGRRFGQPMRTTSGHWRSRRKARVVPPLTDFVAEAPDQPATPEGGGTSSTLGC